jgi:beta-N-acetylglucosaminidase
MTTAVVAIAVALCVQSSPIVSYANEKPAEFRSDSAVYASDNEDETAEHDDGSSVLVDRYQYLDLRNAEPISHEEEKALLGNWGDSYAEDGD